MMTAWPAPVRTIDDLRGRRAVVLGLARSGVAASRFLADSGAEVAAYDRRSATDLGEAVATLAGRAIRLELGAERHAVGALLRHAELVVTSPSISTRFPTTDPWLREALIDAEARGVELVSEVGLFLRLTRARILAVTGTKGKTTTASLVAAILAAAEIPSVLGGNIGTPLIERSGELGPDAWAVLELSELQLPTIERGADLALYTNIGADHLDRHPSVAAYRAVKARLAELTAPDGRVVLNAEDPGCLELGERLPSSSLAWYGYGRPRRSGTEAWVDEDGWVTVGGERVLPAAEVPLPGRHMLANVLGAALVAHLAGAAVVPMAGAVRGFGGVPHRLELIDERDGVRWVNDSQATIPVAAVAALEAFEAPIVVIGGGSDKGLDQRPFADAIARRARAAVLIGETADAVEQLIAERVPVRRASSMEEAVVGASGLARPGDVVVLAPAAASFDMFADYAARGDAFRTAVAALGARR
jgi:UDP-N-acetylmuramoylalanine--D-glutamate ligase